MWAKEAALLAQVGQQLFDQPTRVQVRIPRRLADEAVEAWRRDDDDDSPLPAETPAQRETRHRAGTLGLIGLSIEHGGLDEGDHVVVDVDSWLVGLALEAADEAGLIRGAPGSP